MPCTSTKTLRLSVNNVMLVCKYGWPFFGGPVLEEKKDDGAGGQDRCLLSVS